MSGNSIYRDLVPRCSSSDAFSLLLDLIDPITSPSVCPLDLFNADVPVMRKIVNALGEIVPDACDAIPSHKTVQPLRVNYIAEEAITKIEGHPMAAWH
jgi:hypothetical protein